MQLEAIFVTCLVTDDACQSVAKAFRQLRSTSWIFLLPALKNHKVPLLGALGKSLDCDKPSTATSDLLAICDLYSTVMAILNGEEVQQPHDFAHPVLTPDVFDRVLRMILRRREGLGSLDLTELRAHCTRKAMAAQHK